MRRCINAANVDTTAALSAYIQQNNKIICADLYQVSVWFPANGDSTPPPVNYFFTDYDRPLAYIDSGGNSRTYQSGGYYGPIGRTQLTFTDQLQVDNLQMFWAPPPGMEFAFDFGLPNCTTLQAFASGVFDNALVLLYRAMMPFPGTPAFKALGDLETFGAIALFAGRVASCDIGPLRIDMKVPSLVELLDTLVPANLIEPGFRGGYANQQNGVPVLDALGNAATFEVAAGTNSNTGFIVASCTSNPGQIFPNDAFDLGYLQIGGNTAPILKSGSGTYSGTVYNTFLLAQPLPSKPPPGSSFEPMVPPPANINYNPDDPNLAVGFPYVPLATAANSSVFT